MFVAGTAGHVDHGKSTLIRALTGIDPDRLAEEKKRGMTIELGFAWIELDDGTNISIVDVPGHERFVKHMIMGAGGFDIALLVVAADEGFMAQTREHVAILDLLEVQHGIVVITKTDIADDDLAEIVELEVAEELAGTTLEGSPTVRVSALTGDGIHDLREAIALAARDIEPRIDRDEPRMYVDRSFNIAGFGAVLTGTLDRGALSAGDDVLLLPSGSRGRIRGLQSHNQSVDKVGPGNRAAINVNGLGHAEVPRGEAVVKARTYQTTKVFDAILRAVPSSPRPIRHNHKVSVYGGTWEEPATVRLLSSGSLSNNESAFAQIVLGGKRPLATSDKFIVRDTNDTLGGGTVLVVDAPRHKRNDDHVLQGLQRLAGGSERDIVLQHLSTVELTTIESLARRSGIGPDALETHLAELLDTGDAIKLTGNGGAASAYAAGASWESVARRIVEAVSDYHSSYPLRPGMPRQALRGASKLDHAMFEAAIAHLTSQRELEEAGTAVRLSGFAPTPSQEQLDQARAYVNNLRAGGYSPPSGTQIDSELLALLVGRAEVVVAGDVVFEAGKFNEMRDGVIARCRTNGEVGINDVREMFATSRKYSLALLEQLDRDNVTMRVGDARKLR